MAGGKLVEEILLRAPDRFQIRMFGGEPQTDRILLSGVLNGGDPQQLQLHPPEWFEQHGILVHAGVKVESIDRRQRRVVGAGGKVEEPYDVLVLATGARSTLPEVHERPGIFAFRTIEDCLAIGAHARDCESAVVLGTGPLAEMALAGLRRLGLEVETRAEADPPIPAELLVVCHQDQPNIEPAKAAGIEVRRGIVVDEHLRTSDPSIYALGACAEEDDPISKQARRLAEVLTGVGPDEPPSAESAAKNKIETLKLEKDGLDSLEDLLRLIPNNNWQEMTEDDKHRAKWHGLFFRKQTPGHFMLRIRGNAGQMTACQLKVIADLTDEYGKGFADLTTRQQIQMRWFTLRDTPEIWRRLEEVGLHSKQTGMDNVRGVCGCPVAGLTPSELFDATPVVKQLTDLIVGNREFTNLPRKFNVTITACLENCCHTETQDIALVPAFRELEEGKVDGFNVFAGGKQGSGGYTPALALDIFIRREEASELSGEIIRIFRDHGSRETRNRARLAFLLEDRGVEWFRAELERRRGAPLLRAGTDLRKPHHVDHLGIHPQKHRATEAGPQLYYAGLLVPVGRITTAQMRGVADLAERFGNGDIRLTVGQNIIIPNIPENRIGAFSNEPLLQELPIDPSPILRGLVACTGTDYCHLALIETKGWAVTVARELEKRTVGQKLRPLTIHWSGCSAGCGLHQVATIGLQGCRSRVNGQVVDAAHVCVNGQSGPEPVVASDLMYDVPCEHLPDALEPLVRYLPRS
jgi:ferredoxin-nitrite reductase